MISEWNPETAQAPPDLSAMPLWVDLRDVPAHLYSHQGLSFLSSTAGKFVKLHPNTERCLRLDVARTLVEVNLEKPLIDRICFPDKNGKLVTVAVSYPWLPPKCSLCSKWGHNVKECSKKVVLQTGDGIQSKSTRSVQQIAQDLLTDLERTPAFPESRVTDTVPHEPTENKSVLNVHTDLERHVESDEGEASQWTAIARKSPESSPSRIATGEIQQSAAATSNIFGVLGNVCEEEILAADTVLEANQDLCLEEGEVVESESEKVVGDNPTNLDPQETTRSQQDNGIGKHRSRPRGPKKSIVSRKEIVSSTKASSRKL